MFVCFICKEKWCKLCVTALVDFPQLPKLTDPRASSACMIQLCICLEELERGLRITCDYAYANEDLC
ncbi:unnamed protein product [Thlaspi arvense]|uniref:Uncharacterized protein n=1 Tax=Thlaspi arvense TaxID=13288 RepID=A0AAU9SHH6_THLAR|nr:unnamed protein product [Thlaspi arvense]